ncbi:HamA C-terminal domain-containing protein [Lactococcus lactis]|uniref:HamA C-terminal domain-containing protein n=1 Tax=Lactococcus lactis TaxID=1358 RepID=UPI00204B2C84|nr:DUF1837 domain-containing protein [Lactococcus lactis]BDH84659.1 hypothetical protein LLID5_19440 [Lactococcus lactis]
MEIGDHSSAILGATKHLGTAEIAPDNKLEIFSFPINSNSFDYKNACGQLLESVAEFTLSRQYREKYKNEPIKLSKEARTRFKDWKEQTGELGEFLLFCFLEGHLKAPKILSKFELKTSTSMHVHGSDGVHYVCIGEGRYQLLFGESKLYKDLTSGLRDAFKSIQDFKQERNEQGNSKSGISFERSLISANLSQETFSDEEKIFLKSLLFPTNDGTSLEVDDAFGIFVGFEVGDYGEQRKTLNNHDFREFVYKSILEQVQAKTTKISEYIDDKDLHGHTFYIYVLPFTKIDDGKEIMLRELLS